MTASSAPIALARVFGISTQPILSYVYRDDVDARFKRALDEHHHIVVYGSSKQGKTSLRQKHLADSRCVVVHCGPDSSHEDIYHSILRQAGARVQTITTSTMGIGAGGKVKTGFVASIPFLGAAKGDAEASADANAQLELTSEFISYNFGDAQAVCEALRALHFNKFVILENFHYLPESTQQRMAFDLRTFHEVGIRFIVLGIWREANLLMTHNGDLEDRVVEIPVEPWKAEDFKRVAATGAEILNVEIDGEFVEKFIELAYENVGMLQEFLKLFCDLSGVEAGFPPGQRRILNDPAVLAAAVQRKLEAQQGQLLKVLQGIAAKSRVRPSEEPLLLPYYLVKVILETPVDQLQKGIEKNQLLNRLRDAHHRPDKEAIRSGDITNLLVKLPVYQRDIHPTFVYYDSNSRRLKIVDTRHFFVLARADRAALLDDVPFPLDVGS